MQLVGILQGHAGEVRFSYDPTYAGEPISSTLPLTSELASASATSCFFSALIPEGSARREFARLLHAEQDEYKTFLERLNDESIGALLFSALDEPPYRDPGYREVESGFFDELAERPLETAISTMGKTRLSLSGAMAKVGLYRDGNSGKWYYPTGGAPSTHIVKAADDKRFPLETINESLCLGVARRCGLPAAETHLVKVGSCEPLLAVRRFDRPFEGTCRIIDGLPAPIRLHQEDFCQATGVSLKYEPTDGNYLQLLTNTTRSLCQNAFGEAHLAVEYTVFDYLLGNCDNHLKNYSLLYSRDWKTCELSPLYDVVSTVAYPEIYKEMGVSFGGDRRIDHVRRADLFATMKACGFSGKLAKAIFEELASTMCDAIEAESRCIESEGFEQVSRIAEPLLEGVKKRTQVCMA